MNNAQVSKLKVTDHIIRRFRERSHFYEASNERITKLVKKHLDKSVRMRIKPEFEAEQIRKHGSIAEYWSHKQYLFIITCSVLRTAHTAAAGMWEPFNS